MGTSPEGLRLIKLIYAEVEERVNSWYVYGVLLPRLYAALALAQYKHSVAIRRAFDMKLAAMRQTSREREKRKQRFSAKRLNEWQLMSTTLEEMSSTFTTRLKEVVSTLGRTKKPSLVRVLLGLPRARTAFGTIRSRFSVR